MFREIKKRRRHVPVFLLASLTLSASAIAGGDAAKGSRDFHNQCSSCHSLEPGRHMTGPSLAGIAGRKAGSVEGFDRYSKALSQSAIEWNEQTLTPFLADPQAVVPGNTMTARVADPVARAGIVAYLLAAQPSGGGGGRTDIPKPHENILDLKSAGPATRVARIAYCRDTYTVTLENGAAVQFWERNLRFKTDSSKEGPHAGKPVLVPGGMHGDRAYIVFAAPGELSGAIADTCTDD